MSAIPDQEGKDANDANILMENATNTYKVMEDATTVHELVGNTTAHKMKGDATTVHELVEDTTTHKLVGVTAITHELEENPILADLDDNNPGLAATKQKLRPELHSKQCGEHCYD